MTTSRRPGIRRHFPPHRTALVGAFLALALAAPGPLAAEDEPAGDLDWTVGSWEGVRRDGEGGEAPATLRVEPILGGAGYAEHLEVSHGEDLYRGYAVTTYDTEAGHWVRHYANAVRGRLVRLDGEVAGERSTWTITTPGRSRESRLVSERIEGGRWQRTHQVSEDGGETWRILWQDELERASDR